MHDPPTFSLTVEGLVPAGAEAGSTAKTRSRIQLMGLRSSATLEDIDEAVKKAGYISQRGFEADKMITVTVSMSSAKPSYDASSTRGLVMTGTQTPIDWFIDYLKFHGFGSHPLASDSKKTETTLSSSTINFSDDGGSIQFMRTLRVPDDGKAYTLPPGLENFPLLPVEPFSKNLPDNIVKRGGYFLPMYQREALWISLPQATTASGAFRIAVGGVNAVSGLPHASSAPLKDAGSQDYLVAGVQPWLDGICTEPGTVKQFVAMPLEKGFTIRKQSMDTTKGGIQIDFYPRLDRYVTFHRISEDGPSDLLSFHTTVGKQLTDGASVKIRLGRAPERLTLWNTLAERQSRVGPVPLSAVYTDCNLLVKTLHGRPFTLELNLNDTVDTLKEIIQAKEGIPPDHQRLIFTAKELETGFTLRDYGIKHNDTIHLILRIRSDYSRPSQIVIPAGGRIEPKIYADSQTNFSTYSQRPVHRVFVHAVSTRLWELATGTLAPPTPITRLLYTRQNIPWFSLYDEHVVSVPRAGRLQNVQSIDDTEDQEHRMICLPPMPPSDERELDRDTLPSCNVCVDRTACVVLRPCSHCVCGTCLSKIALGGSICLACWTRVFIYMGFKVPARGIIASDDAAFEKADVFINAPLVEDFGYATVVTNHLLEDEPADL